MYENAAGVGTRTDLQWRFQYFRGHDRAIDKVSDRVFNQAGVIPYRIQAGEIEVLLITAARRQHWVIPKGWVELFQTLADAAAREAWEEAGIRGTVRTPAIGSYLNHKWGFPVPVHVFLMQVAVVEAIYPERDRRLRQWFGLTEAIVQIQKAELKQLLQQLPIVLFNGEAS